MALLIRILLLALVIYFVVLAIRQFLSSAPRPSPPEPNNDRVLDPYEILGIQRGASKEEIKKAYRRTIAQYHPDKVGHLGEEIQKLARQKTQEITEAYNRLN
jgi:DnaJ-class molecular chaperone